MVLLIYYNKIVIKNYVWEWVLAKDIICLELPQLQKEIKTDIGDNDEKYILHPQYRTQGNILLREASGDHTSKFSFA